jgi:hypothetical protein
MVQPKAPGRGRRPAGSSSRRTCRTPSPPAVRRLFPKARAAATRPSKALENNRPGTSQAVATPVGLNRKDQASGQRQPDSSASRRTLVEPRTPPTVGRPAFAKAPVSRGGSSKPSRTAHGAISWRWAWGLEMETRKRSEMGRFPESSLEPGSCRFKTPAEAFSQRGRLT